VITVADDALERRIARFVAEEKAPYSVNGTPDICLGTCIGAVREQNQDRALITFASYPTAPEKSFALGIVCDGMGGLARGDEAAVIAVSVFASRVIRWPNQPTPDRLRWAALAANQAVYRSLSGRGGATLSAVMVGLPGTVVGVNAGDSRIYGLTRSRDVKQLSRDDNVAALLGQQEGFGANQLVQFVGMGDGIAPRIIDADQNEFDSILITTDGVHCASPATFAQAVRAPTNNHDLIRRLLALNDALGGHDNGTALVLPTRFEAPNGDSEQGLNLTFWSPSDRLEIWIPAL
jgi:PPM family protein phosphatase